MYPMTDEEFETAIQEALDAMPEQFLEALENVAVVWEDEPNEYHLGSLDADGDNWDGDDRDGGASWEGDGDIEADGGGDDYVPGPNDLLGLFDGLSIVERADGYDDDIPNVITVFKGPHERCFGSREEVVAEIGKTVIHELGHYFGLDDDQLYDMGY